MTATSEPGAIPLASIPDLDSVIARYEARQQRRAELRPANKAAMFDALAAAGIATVVVSFDGYGDSGQIERIEARNREGEVDLPRTDVTLAVAHYNEDDPDLQRLPLERAVEQLAYDALAELHGGWENNEGAYGDFAFEVGKRTISLAYHERYTVTEDHVHEL